MKIDLARRRRVMERSQRLGHCICDVRRPCPCDLLREQNLCPCAGERPEPTPLAKVKLTELVHNAGCASKIAPADLDAVLGRLPEVNDPAVISGLAASDDAAIYRIADNLCLVQTVDVFTPCVDDPRLFGRICAANCLSDIYAMGGEPRTALSILAFPAEILPGELMFQMLAGAMETFAEAGVALVGGHSIKDQEIKLGFAITGLIDPAVASALETPQPGDVLVLTKPLGTGVLAFAQQIGRGHAEGSVAAQTAMAALNRGAAEAMRLACASACTDVTGFGLFAHLMRMLRASGLAAQVFGESLPAFPGALELLRAGVIPGAIERNREYVGEVIRVAPDVDEARVNLGFDAQTSGGLLIAVPPARLAELQRQLALRGVTGAVIGRITGESEVRIEVLAAATDCEGFGVPALAGPESSCAPGDRLKPGLQTEKVTPALFKPETADIMNPSSSPGTHSSECCADVFGASPGASISTVAESQRAFGALLRSVQAPGALDAKVKELILFSQVLQSRCAPCFDAHYRKALEMGLTQAELDEAAWCAIAMGGAPVKMFYQECLERVKQE